MVIDVRNNYETRIGKFKGAVDPCTTSFREFPSWVEEHFQLSETDDSENPKLELNNSVQPAEKEMENQKQQMPRVAMYCTGGIRCEKATSLLLSKGFKEVILSSKRFHIISLCNCGECGVGSYFMFIIKYVF